MEISKEEIRDRLGNIEQIRDILFGPQIRDYEGRFRQLESKFANFEQEVGDRLSKLDEKLSGEIHTAVDSLEKKLKYLSLTTHEEITDVRQNINRTESTFSGNLESVDRSAKNQIRILKEDLTSSTEKLQQELQALKVQMTGELERGFTSLKEGKISREDLAEILFEVCMKVRGTDFVPDLKEAAGNLKSDFILPDQSQG